MNTNASHPQSVTDYIASQPQHSREALKRVRRAIREALARAKETISYKMPAYELNGETIIYFAGWKRHYSLYPAPSALVAHFKGALASHKIHKGTIRFPLSEPVPARLIERIAKFRSGSTARNKLEVAVRKKPLCSGARRTKH